MSANSCEIMLGSRVVYGDNFMNVHVDDFYSRVFIGNFIIMIYAPFLKRRMVLSSG